MLAIFIKSILTGIKRRWRFGLMQAFGIAGAIWLMTEITIAVSPSVQDWLHQDGILYTSFIIVAGTIWFFAYTYESRSVSFLIPTTDSQITIRYGNLLAEPTDWLFGVGEFFDSEIGQPVSQKSLHGQFIATTYNGNSTRFRADVDKALTGVANTPSLRTIQPSAKYPIGTTAILQNGSHKVFLVAMAHTDIATSKASSTVPMLWDALKEALSSIRSYGNGAPISLPLIGNGQAGVNVEPQHLLRLIVLALVDFGRKVGLPKNVNIIVTEECFEKLDIREIERDWKTR
jgi:hypothetical protein